MRYLILILVLLLVASCTSESHLTLMSNEQININDFSINTSSRGGYVEGEDVDHIIIVDTGSRPAFSDAYVEATQGKSATKLVNVKLYSWGFGIPFYGQNGFEVSGYEAR